MNWGYKIYMDNTQKTLEFRKPDCREGRYPNMINSECALNACEDLNYDMTIMVKNPDQTIQWLDAGVFQFYKKEEWIYQQNRIYDYMLILSGYEVLVIKTYDDDGADELHYCAYLYNSYGHFYNYGYEEICGCLNDSLVEEIFEVCKEWLKNQPFETQGQYRKYCYDEREKAKTQ